MTFDLGKTVLWAFIALALLAGGLRIGKSVGSGLQVDEAFHFRFANSFDTAAARFPNEIFSSGPNEDPALGTANHQVNYLLIYYLNTWYEKIFKKPVPHAHFQRIPIVLMGLLYVLSITWLIHRLIANPILKLLALILCLFNYYLFDLNIISRGYGYPLGSFFAGLLLIHLYLRRSFLFGRAYLAEGVLVLSLSLVMWISIGAMLASFLLMACLGVATLLAVFFRNKDQRHRFTLVILVAIGIGALCGGSLYWLIQFELPALAKISKATKQIEYLKGVIPFVINNFDNIFWGRGQKLDFVVFGSLQNWLFRLSAIGSIAFVVTLAFFRAWHWLNRKTSSKPPNADPILSFEQNIWILCLGLYLFLMLVELDLLKRNIGEFRHHASLFPLILVSLAILAERILDQSKAWKSKWLRTLAPLVLLATYSVGLLPLIVRNLPSPYAIEAYPHWGPQSAVYPLMRDLKKIDPTRKWVFIIGDNEVGNVDLILDRYKPFEPNFSWVRGSNEAFNVKLIESHTSDPPGGAFVPFKAGHYRHFNASAWVLK